MKKKLKLTVSNKHWGSLAQGYLKIAEQGFLYLYNQSNLGKKVSSDKNKDLYRLEEGNLIIASIWNIKHGLELVVKGLGTRFNKQYWNNHDLCSLFQDIRLKIEDYCLKRDLDILHALVMKYSHCNFSKKTCYHDINNNYLRYPEVEEVSLDYSFLHDLVKNDIQQFLNDIYNIKRVYDLLEASIQEYKVQYKIYKKEIDKKILQVETIKNPGYKK